jgi:hypothetical protein
MPRFPYLPNCFVECFINLTTLRESNSRSSSAGSLLLIHKLRTQTSLIYPFRREVGTHWLKSAHVHRLRGSTAVTGADGSPCGVIAQIMGVGIVAVLIEDSKCERNVSMIRLPSSHLYTSFLSSY